MSYLEIGRARRQDDPVGPDELTLGTQGDVDQGLLFQETVEDGDEGRTVIVPFQTKLLVIRHRMANVRCEES